MTFKVKVLLLTFPKLGTLRCSYVKRATAASENLVL